MNSPILIRHFSSLYIDRSVGRPVYLQLADGILSLIKNNKLISGEKLPGTRDVSALLHINRITVAKAYDELQTQGWLESFVGRGTFVSPHVPETKPTVLQDTGEKAPQKVAGFQVWSKPHFDLRLSMAITELHLDDGFPDPKLAPLKEFHRAYRNEVAQRGFYYRHGHYGNPAGSDLYRQAISDHLNAKNGYSIPLKTDESEHSTAGESEPPKTDKSEPLKIDSI